MCKIFVIFFLVLFIILFSSCSFDAEKVAGDGIDKPELLEEEEEIIEPNQEREEEVEILPESGEDEEESKENDYIVPTISLKIIEGPMHEEEGDICFYKVRAEVTGNPSPEIEFSRNDSNGNLVANTVQINLEKSENYTLTVIATNEAGKAEDSITLEWESQFPVQAREEYKNDFTLESIEGNQVSLSNYQGKTIVLNFWATWCPPCVAEIPDFVEIYNKYKDKGVQFIGVSLDSDISEIKSFVDKNGINYQILVDDGNVSDKWKITAIPTTFILGKNGDIIEEQVGMVNKDILTNLIDGSM